MTQTTRAFLVAAAVSAACGGGGSSPPPGGGSGGSATGSAYQSPAQDAPDGMELRLSNGEEGAPAYDRAKLAPATKLDDAKVNTILARAKQLVAQAADKQAFALRPRSQPAPKTGTTITTAFPPPPSSLLPPKANDATSALTVLRYMPEGEVPLAPELTVTFSQPMIAVTSQADAAASTPVKLDPQPAGSWRWIGTRTIMFDPDVRFPMATTYKVSVPAGTKSVAGNPIDKATEWTFETPPVRIVSSSPNGGPTRTDVPIFMLFDQKVDQQVIARGIKVTADGKPVAMRLMTAAELDADKAAKDYVAAAKANEQDGRWVAMKATAKYPTDSEITVTLTKGAPSAEGKNLTKEDQSFSFRTYAPLRITEAECGWRNECPPGTSFRIDLNNPLDADKAPEDHIKVTPAVDDLHVVSYGTRIEVMANTTARTSYKITVDAGLTDAFGQTLGKAETFDWNVGDARPTFYGPSGYVVSDPLAKQPTLDFYSVGYTQLVVKLYQVTTADLDAYSTYLRELYNRDKPPAPPGKLVASEQIATTQGMNQLVETSVPLAKALSNGVGHVVAIVEPAPWTESYPAPKLISWVQVTKLGLQAHVDHSDLVGFATDLETGKPASGVELSIAPVGIKGTTNAQGLATLPLDERQQGANYLLAKRGNDTAFLPETRYGGNEWGSWHKTTPGTSLAWYVIDDRRLYKPGEEVSLKGWIRSIHHGKGGDVGMDALPTSVDYRVFDSRNNELVAGSAAVTAVGGFDTTFKLPGTPNLGWARIALGGRGGTSGGYSHSFQIEEFRRPEFEVSAAASQGPFLVGGSGDVTVNAKYFSGGPLPGAPVQWNVYATATSFTPPNRDEYTFGEWTPYWSSWGGGYDDDYGSYRRGGYGGGRYVEPKSYSHTAVTDAIGKHTLKLDFLSVKPTRPMSVQASASVTDVNRQQWTASAALLVHPSSAYVGLKGKKTFVTKGTPYEVDVIGVDVDGKALTGSPIKVRSVRLDWEFKKGEYKQIEVGEQLCNVVSAAEAQPCTFQTAEGGSYRITASITDAQGRPNETTYSYWVSGGKSRVAREVVREEVEVIPDRKEYAAGQTAELLIQAPFYPAEGIVSWRRSGIVKTEHITLDGPTKVVTVPITDAMVPNLIVQVDLVGATERLDDTGNPDPSLPKRPAYAVGSVNLSVPAKQRTLAVTVEPSVGKLGPGEAAQLSVKVLDAAGKPVANSEVAVIVVDEAILALAGYEYPDPIGAFYRGRGPETRDFYQRELIKLANPATGVAKPKAAGRGRGNGGGVLGGAADAVAATAAPADMERAMPGSAPPAEPMARAEGGEAKQQEGSDKDGKSSSGEGPAIAVRSNFNPLAAFSPTVKTDANGAATVSIKVPDNLTRYRIVAIAGEGNRFGKGESAITARLPLMVRPSPPRFLNFGDVFQLPVVVQNQTDAPMTVMLAARTTNLTLSEGAGREVTVPPNDRALVLFPAAAEMAGTARLQIVGVAGEASDAAELALPVWTPATTEAFATYGTIETGAIAQPVALPGQVVTQFGGLEVTTSSTTLQSLTDAVLYLVRYPYECAEQRSSRIMAIAALRDVLSAFQTPDMPTAQAIEASVVKDVDWIVQVQNYDGGFAYWERGRPSDPYLTAFVANALQRAKDKGYAVPQSTLDKAKPYLADIERYYDPDWPADVKRTISAFALYTRKLMGDVDVSKAQRLIADAGGVDKLSMEANGWLLSALAGQAAAETERKAIVRHALNKVSETAGAANFTTSYSDGAYVLLASNHRVDGVMLEALLLEDPKNDLIPKVVTGLLAHRKRGHWLNTQENVFALLAMDTYFHIWEKATPNFVARVWLGDDYAGDHAFRGRTTESHQIDIPMSIVATHDKQALTISKDGPGRLYYRIGMTYAPASLKLEAADYGFVVERIYEGVDAATDVVRQADGTWKIKAGARVRVKIKMVNENRRYHVALVDPLPAGLEPMNPALAMTGAIPVSTKDERQRAGRYWWWYGPWYEHQNMRDERVEAFSSLLWEGVHEYEYVARATTPGNFVVPPTKAEEMYMPETFGRGASDRVIVE